MKRFGLKLIVGAAVLTSVVTFQAEAKNFRLIYGMGGATGAFHNLVSALDATYSCSDANYGEGGTYMLGDGTAGTYNSRSAYSSRCAAGHTSQAASSVVTATATLQAATAQTLGLIGARVTGLKMAARDDSLIATSINQDLTKGAVGIASGEEINGMGVWAQGAYTRLKDTNADTEWNGNVISGLVGIDKQIENKYIVGLSAGYEKTDLNTKFNGGTLDSKGLLIAPYASLMIDDMWSIDVTGGYQWLDYDVERTDTTGAVITGKFDSKRMFAAFVANADHTIDKLMLNGHLGGTYTREEQDAYTESNGVEVAKNSVALGQGVLGGRVAYNAGMAVPFFSATGEYDFKKDKITVAASQTTPTTDKLGLRLAAGADVNFSPNVTGRLEGQSVLLRNNYEEHKAVVKLRIDF
jgi:hypothetical protein